MNTDHKLGRAEAVRDMSRLIYDEVGKIDNHITARTAELSEDHTIAVISPTTPSSQSFALCGPRSTSSTAKSCGYD